jgi:PEGA domain-containing protein
MQINMVATRSNSLRAIKVFALLAALSCLLAYPSTSADAKKKPNYGEIELSTNPGGFPLLIDGKPSGDTSTTVRIIPLDPGRHTIEVQMPNGARWVRDFNVEAGRRQCVVLNYRPRKIVIEKSPCPYPVNVSAPTSVSEGDLITFSSDVAYGGTSPLNYTWTVSPAEAKIVSGAGTPTITVDSTELGGRTVTAILVVDDGSGDAACRQRAQAATNVVLRPKPPLNCRPFDQFTSVAFDDDKARFDNLAIELQNAPDDQAYIIIYAGSRSRPGQADRLGQRTMDYLVRERGLDSRRLTIINGGYRETDSFEIWLCPPGAQPPQATPTVQPGDVRPPVERPRRGRRRR